jgi:hypothetical protein
MEENTELIRQIDDLRRDVAHKKKKFKDIGGEKELNKFLGKNKDGGDLSSQSTDASASAANRNPQRELTGKEGKWTECLEDGVYI